MRTTRYSAYKLKSIRSDLEYQLERHTRWSHHLMRLRNAWTADGHFVNVRHLAERLEFVKEGRAF